jgi:hypothetical protein
MLNLQDIFVLKVKLDDFRDSILSFMPRYADGSCTVAMFDCQDDSTRRGNSGAYLAIVWEKKIRISNSGMHAFTYLYDVLLPPRP